MKHLFETGRADEVKGRLHRLQSTSQRQWGRMTAPQMLAHCVISMEMATGDRMPPRMLAGRIIGWMVKPLALGDDKPLKRNTPTAPELVVADERDLDAERQRLLGLIDRFSSGGRAGCTAHPHTFFGPLTPDEWATLMYKHLDHHLRQFGV
jgi:hypothetical protein